MLLLYYHPHPTGITYYVKMLAEALAKRGHEVTVLAARHTKETPLGEQVLNSVRVIRLWAPIRISRGMIMPVYLWRLFRLMQEHDVVNVHMPMLESVLVPPMARITGVKIVATHHADLVLPNGYLNNVITKMMFAIQQFLARRAHCVVAYSEDNVENSFYLAPHREKTRAIYPPIVIPEPDPERVRQLQSEWRHEGGPLIAFCGRFAEEKRPDLLIRSLEIINKRYPNARVVFAGETDIPYEDTWNRFSDLVARNRSQLIFLGLLTNKQELANFYAACDVLVVPSDIEVFALVQGEAMLCGTPVVTTNIYGGREAVNVTGMGKLAEKGDWQSLGETINEVLDEPERFIKPREFIQATFSFEKTVDQYCEIFHEAR
ncbi:MAG: glycosyltransferase family 4 protein [Chloroflexi bacterium]|nr:glycosyltransferase family 4 protein [Chloroflexota bacterium]